VTAADRPYGEFYDFYRVSPEYFGFTVVHCVGKKEQIVTLQRHSTAVAKDASLRSAILLRNVAG
jgi:hypothetical protein